MLLNTHIRTMSCFVLPEHGSSPTKLSIFFNAVVARKTQLRKTFHLFLRSFIDV